jgi:hypothetical protein
MPLDSVLERLKEDAKVVSWCDYFEAGVDHGWKWDRIFSMIEYSLDDIYGREYSREVLTRLKFYVVRRVNGAWAPMDDSVATLGS